MSSHVFINHAPQNDSKQRVLRALLIAMSTFPTIIIVVRFWSRYLFVTPGSWVRTRFWWDDWTALVTAVLNIAVCTVGLKLVDYGMGLHIEDVPPADIEPFLKYLWAVYFLFDTGTAVAKSSALLFYARVFGTTTSKFKYGLWSLHAMNVAWWASFCLAPILECKPIEKAWKPAISGTCGNTQTIWLAGSITSLLIDVLILIIPMPILWKLHIEWVRKLQIIGVFVCAYLVVVVSIGRLISIVKAGVSLQTDPTYKIATPVLWLGSEIAISITSVSLPSLLFLAQRGWRQGPRALFSSHYHTPASKHLEINATRKPHRAGEGTDAELDTRPFNNIESLPGNASFKIEHPYWNNDPGHLIHIRRDFVVS